MNILLGVSLLESFVVDAPHAAATLNTQYVLDIYIYIYIYIYINIYIYMYMYTYGERERDVIT